MPLEEDWFRCPTCGMHAPAERLSTEDPFPFDVFDRIVGGKVKLTDEEREARKGSKFRRGSARGKIVYDLKPMNEELKNQMEIRIAEIHERGV